MAVVDESTSAAIRKARALLESYLDERQRSQLSRWDGFAQTGSDGRCYVVLVDTNDTVYDPADGRGRGYYPHMGSGVARAPWMPSGDVALAMKLAVETDAPHLQRHACTMSVRGDDVAWPRVDRIWADHCGGAENTHEDPVDRYTYFAEHPGGDPPRFLEERRAAEAMVDLGSVAREAAAAARYPVTFNAVPENDVTPDGYSRQQLTEEDWSHPYRGEGFERRWFSRPAAPDPAPGLRITGGTWRVEFNGRLQATLDPAWVTDVRSELDWRPEYHLDHATMWAVQVPAERTITLTFSLTDFEMRRVYDPPRGR